jgi:ankyrin repeat protein
MVNRADPNDAQTAVVGQVSRGYSTALLFAVSAGSLECVKLLLDGGASVDETAPDGASALVIAVHSDYRAVSNLLLDRGANPNLVGAGYTALHAAVLRGDADLVKNLLAHGARVDATLQHGTPTIRAGSGFVLPENLTGATPLLLASKFLELEICRLLIARGANIRATLSDGTTAMMLAAGLLSQGPLFDRRGRITLLRTADEPAALQAVKLLVERGLDPNAVNERGETALHGAAARGYPQVVKLLVDRGANPAARTTAGRSALDLADPVVKDLLGDLKK